ncbi:MAG: DNA polymerase III subunit delta [Gemmatimonadaceae bacterium]|nr:DNA polymerase III subunit delta [Gemmatimonadaceae bacterium]
MASAGEKALHAALKKRVFDPVYYLFGDDDFLKDASLRQLIAIAVDPATRDFNLEQRRGAELGPDGIDSLLGTPPMLSDRRVVVIRDADKLKKDARVLLDAYLTRPAPDTVLVLVSAAGVKEDKALVARSVAVNFAPLSGDRVQNWIVHHVDTILGRTITAGAVSLLIEAVGLELSMIAVELEKLASFKDGEIDELAVETLVGVRRGESIGDFLDAVAARDAAAALVLIPHVLQQPKTTGVSIVMNLTVQTLALAYASSTPNGRSMSRASHGELVSLLKETGAFPGRPWGEAVSTWTRYGDRWTPDSLDAALAALLRTDEALKNTALSSEEQTLTSLVLGLCGGDLARRVA